jgi:hypothetical protein
MRSRVPEWRDAVARLTLAQTPTNDGDVDGRPGDRVAPFAIGPFARKGYGVGAVMILAQQLDPSPRRRRILPEFAQTMLSCRHLCSHVEAKAAFAAPGWRKGWEHSTQRNFNGLAWQTARAPIPLAITFPAQWLNPLKGRKTATGSALIRLRSDPTHSRLLLGMPYQLFREEEALKLRM